MRPKGIRYVTALFVCLGVLILACVGWAVFGFSIEHIDVPTTLRPKWVLLSTTVGLLLLFAAAGIRAGKRQAWILGVVLNILLLGSVLLLPLLIPSLVILLKKETRDFVKQE